MSPPRWRSGGFYDPAADRRRHHQPHPHRGQDRPALRARPDRLCRRRQPRRRRRRPAALARRRRRPTSPASRPNTPSSPTPTTAPRPTSSACRSPPPAPTPHTIDWSAYTPPKPSFLGTRVFEDWDLADLARYIDWTPFFQTWELKGRYPQDPRGRDPGRGRPRRSSPTPGHARRRSSTNAGSSRAPSSASGPPTPSATTSGSSPTTAAPQELATFFTLRQQLAKRLGQKNVALSDFVAPEAARPTMSAASSSPPASRSRRSPSASNAPTTTTTPSWSRPWPTASPRPSPSAARAGPPRVLGLRRRRELRAGRPDRRALSRHPPGPRLSGPARPHREGDALPPARRRARHRRHA